MAKYRYQQQYHDRLRRQQVSWSTRSYNYYNDPYYYTPNRYRYSYQGNWQRTNRYGADLIRQAINYGYQEGLYAGRADRQVRSEEHTSELLSLMLISYSFFCFTIYFLFFF